MAVYSGTALSYYYRNCLGIRLYVISVKQNPGELAFIALGSNLDDSRRTIARAMERLQEISDAPLLRSSLYETEPVDCPPESPPFINAVVGFKPKKDETPETLLAKLQAFEAEFGRKPKTV